MKIFENRKYTELFIQNHRENKKTIEETLWILKEEGANPINCVMVLVDNLKLSIQEADEIILNSKAWVHLKNSSIRFREEFGDYLENLDGNS